MHRNEDDGETQQKVQRECMAEERGTQKTCVQSRNRTAVLLQDGVCVLEEETGQYALQRVIGHQHKSHLRYNIDISACT